MRVAGIRADGAVWLNLDGGMAVILSGDRCSPPVDPSACEKLGPWTDAHGVSGSDRREIQLRLDRARTQPLVMFQLAGKKKFKFEYSVEDHPDEKKIGDEPATDEAHPGEKAIGDEPTDEPALDDTQVAAAGVVAKKKKPGFFDKVAAMKKPDSEPDEEADDEKDDDDEKEAVTLSGTSAGATKAWATRKRGGAGPDAQASGPDPDAKDNPKADMFNGMNSKRSTTALNGVSKDKRTVNVTDRYRQTHEFTKNDKGVWEHHTGGGATPDTAAFLEKVVTSGVEAKK